MSRPPTCLIATVARPFARGTTVLAASGRLAALAALLLVATAPHAGAQFTPPIIAAQHQARGVGVSLQADVALPFSDTRSTQTGGTFDDTVSGQVGGIGSSAQGGASLRSSVTSFTIDGEGTASCGATGDAEFPATASCSSVIEIFFSVPVDTPFSLTGTVEAMGNGASPDAFAKIQFFGVDPADQVIFETASSDLLFGGGEQTLFATGTMKAGAAQTLVVEARVNAITFPSSTDGTATFEVRFDIGDEDDDGLLDVWETDGIDVDGDGTPEVDLPAMGADPKHKDVFVEIDAMTGAAPAPGILGDVQNAFALAPAALVDNPDGQPGVSLHFVDEAGDQVDEDTVPAQLFGSNPWPGFDQVKQSFFGRAADRAKPNWDDIEDAWRHVFRYCLWAQAAYDPATDPTGRTSPTGIAERPGNDCIIFKDMLGLLGVGPDGEAGTFMHELGHTLGLRHGGTDDVPFKPQYFSVMNYTFQVPIAGFMDAWFLDYSRTRWPSLDEAALQEPLGAAGTPIGFSRTLWNCAPEGDPRRRCSTSLHSFQPIDWNDSGAIETDPVARNLNDVYPVANPDLTADDQVLEGANDWSRLWYHLTGSGNFADGVRDLGALPVELTVEQIEGLAAAEKFETGGGSGTTTSTTAPTGTSTTSTTQTTTTTSPSTTSTSVVATTTSLPTTSTTASTTTTTTLSLPTTTSVSTTSSSTPPTTSTTSSTTTSTVPGTRLFPPGTKLLVTEKRSGAQRLHLLARGNDVSAAQPCAVDGELVIAALGAVPRRLPLAAMHWRPLAGGKASKGCRYRDSDGARVRIEPGKRLKVVARGDDLGVPLGDDPRPVGIELRHGDVRHCFEFDRTTKGKVRRRRLLARKAGPATACPLDAALAPSLSPASAP